MLFAGSLALYSRSVEDPERSLLCEEEDPSSLCEEELDLFFSLERFDLPLSSVGWTLDFGLDSRSEDDPDLYL